MLNQAELNFYGFNPNNIMMRENRGRVSVSISYNANQAKGNCFVVTRKTPKTTWQDHYADLEKAKRRYWEFLYLTNDDLEALVKGIETENIKKFKRKMEFHQCGI